MTTQSIVAQAGQAPRDPALNVSEMMGRIVGVLLIVIIVVWVVQKARGKK